MRSSGFTLFFIVAALGLAGCTTYRSRAESVAAERGWRQAVIPTATFDLMSYAPPLFRAGEPLIVYIDGDGNSWTDRFHLTDDPTPRHPMVLELAMADGRANAVYLARPCQYVAGSQRRNCQPAYWDTAAYHEDVIAATDQAITSLVQRAKARSVILVGYSGGGAVAALVAARRRDCAGLVTIAGVLDHAAWTKAAGLQPLWYSLNPADVADRLVGLPQVHFSGGNDRTVPTAVTQSFVARFPLERRPRVEIIPGFDHGCCWKAEWRTLLLKTPGMPNASR